MVILLKNSLGNLKLNFDDIVGLMLNEKVYREASGKTWNVFLNVEGKGRSLDKNSSRNFSMLRRGKSKSKSEKVKVNS